MGNYVACKKYKKKRQSGFINFTSTHLELTAKSYVAIGTVTLSIIHLPVSFTRDVLFTIETGHSAVFCCQALWQLEVSVTLSRSHCTRHLHTKIMLSRNIAKLL